MPPAGAETGRAGSRRGVLGDEVARRKHEILSTKHETNPNSEKGESSKRMIWPFVAFFFVVLKSVSFFVLRISCLSPSSPVVFRHFLQRVGVDRHDLLQL